MLIRFGVIMLLQSSKKKFFKKKFFWLHFMAYGILVPQPGIEPMSPALKVWSLNHWAAGEVPQSPYFFRSTF